MPQSTANPDFAFEVGKTYCTYSKKITVTITKRSKCYVSGIEQNGETFRRKILKYAATYSYNGDGRVFECFRLHEHVDVTARDEVYSTDEAASIPALTLDETPETLYLDAEDSFSDYAGDNSAPLQDIPECHIPEIAPIVPNLETTEPITHEIVNPCAAVVPYEAASGLRFWLRFISIYLRLWFASHIPSQPTIEAKGICSFLVGGVVRIYTNLGPKNMYILRRESNCILCADDTGNFPESFPVHVHEDRESETLHDLYGNEVSYAKYDFIGLRQPVRFEIGKSYSAFRYDNKQSRHFTVTGRKHTNLSDYCNEFLFISMLDNKLNTHFNMTLNLDEWAGNVEIYKLFPGDGGEPFIFRADRPDDDTPHAPVLADSGLWSLNPHHEKWDWINVQAKKNINPICRKNRAIIDTLATEQQIKEALLTLSPMGIYNQSRYDRFYVSTTTIVTADADEEQQRREQVEYLAEQYARLTIQRREKKAKTRQREKISKPI